MNGPSMDAPPPIPVTTAGAGQEGTLLRGVVDLSTAKRRAVHGAGATLIAQALKFVLKFGAAVVLARLLDPAEFGIVAMVGPIIAFASTLNDLGFAQAVVQRREITAEQVSRLFWINVAASIGLAITLVLLSPLIGWMYSEPRTVEITIVLAALIVIGTLGVVPTALLNREMRFLPIVAIDMAQLCVSVGSAIFMAWAGFGYWALVLSQVVATIFGVICTLAVARWRPFAPKRRAEVGPLVRFGIHLTGVNLATFFSMSADNIIIGIVSGKVPLGLYERSYTLVLQPLGQLMAPLGRVAIPLLAQLNGDPARFRSAYANMLSLGAIFTAPAMICCTMLAGPIVTGLLGDDWREAGPIFSWISFGGIFASAFYSTGWVFTTEGRTGQQLSLSIVTALISIASFGLGVLWGAVGVAAVNALTFSFIQLPLMMHGMTRQGAIRKIDVVRAVVPLIFAGGLTGSAIWVASDFVVPNLVGIGLLFFLAYGVFGLTVLLFPGGRSLLRSIWAIRHSLRTSATT
jgi:polysaccharide transporter, PST family